MSSVTRCENMRCKAWDPDNRNGCGCFEVVTDCEVFKEKMGQQALADSGVKNTIRHLERVLESYQAQNKRLIEMGRFYAAQENWRAMKIQMDAGELARETLKKEVEEQAPADNQTRGEVLKEALKTINGERQDVYGNPEDSFKLIGEYWSSYLKANGMIVEEFVISPREVAEMLALFKIARMSGQKPAIDNYVDASGYLGLAGDMT